MTPQFPDAVERWKLERLIPHARNARTHSEQQVAQIAGSIAEFGFVNPVLVGDDGVMVAGHGRVLAARKLGLSEVPVIVLSHLTPTQRRALENQLNRIADKLIDMAADSLWAKAFGGSGGINLFSLLGLGSGGAGAGGGAAVGVVGAAGGMVVPTFMHRGGLVGRDGDRGGPLPESIFAGAPRLHGGGGIDWAAGERPIIGLIGERMLNRREAADYEHWHKGGSRSGPGVAPRIGLDLKVSVDEGGNLVPLIQKVAGAEADVRIDHHDRFKLPRLIQRHRRSSMLETGRD